MKRLAAVTALFMTTLLPTFAAPPTVSEKVPDFVLSIPDGKPAKLSEVNAQGPTALVVLRGYPGY